MWTKALPRIRSLTAPWGRPPPLPTIPVAWTSPAGHDYEGVADLDDAGLALAHQHGPHLPAACVDFVCGGVGGGCVGGGR